MKKQICDMTKNEAINLLIKKKRRAANQLREIKLIKEAIEDITLS